MRTSYSAIETFRNCPQKYKFQVIDRIPAPKSKPAVFGTLVHDALRFMFSKDPVFPTLEEVRAHFRNAIETSNVFSAEDKPRYAELGDTMLVKFHKANPPWNFTVLDLESRFEIVIEDKEKNISHTLAGIIDRIDKKEDGTYEVIDYKTSRTLPAQDVVDNNLQLSLYHLALTRRWPHLEPNTITLSLYYLKAGEKLSTSRDSEKLEATKAALLTDIQQIEHATTKTDFPPKPSPLCDFCGYKTICPAWRHLYRNHESPTPDDAAMEKILTRFVELKRAGETQKKEIAELAQSIQSYMDSEKLERLFTSDTIIARSIIERSTWDMDAAREILEREKCWENILSGDEKKLKTLLPSLSPLITKELKARALKIKRSLVLRVTKQKTPSKITSRGQE